MRLRSRSVRLVLVKPSRLSSVTNTLGMFLTLDSTIGSRIWRRLSSDVFFCLLSTCPVNSARSDSNFRRSFSALDSAVSRSSLACISSICWDSNSSIMSRVCVSRSGAAFSAAWASLRAGSSSPNKSGCVVSSSLGPASPLNNDIWPASAAVRSGRVGGSAGAGRCGPIPDSNSRWAASSSEGNSSPCGRSADGPAGGAPVGALGGASLSRPSDERRALRPMVMSTIKLASAPTPAPYAPSSPDPTRISWFGS